MFHKLKKNKNTTLLIATLFLITFATAWLVHTKSAEASEGKFDKATCSFNGIPLKGKVKIVENWPDIKVKIVDNWPDLKVKKVDNWPDECGKWKFVENWPDFKIKFVENWPDVKIKFVENWPGVD